jgi:hypothetical protein
MKKAPLILIICLCVGNYGFAQSRKKQNPRARGRTAQREKLPAQTNANAPRIIGTTIVIVTKNEDRITGTLLDLTAYAVRIRADRLESTIALDTIASISFGAAAMPRRVSEPTAIVRPEFIREAEGTISAFQSLASQLRSGTGYTEFDRRLVELRRTAERFIDKNSVTENQAESRVVALLAGALTDYTWARTIWTLKFGRSGDGSVFDSDSPAISDAIALYPDVRAAAASGNKFSTDKLVSGIWKKAEDKIDRARAALQPAR